MWTPPCPHCDSLETAVVHAHTGDYVLQIALATSKLHLADGDGNRSRYYCNSCARYFG